MIDLMEVDDTKDLMRDTHSKALLSVNQNKLKEHNLKRDALRLAYKNSSDILKLNDDLTEIKELLKLLINK
jgi:hypothetical protein